jgi:sulfur relay (sulfurtransferase) DsrC/TusE family protein
MRMIQEIPDLFDDDGFLADPDLWDRDLALRVAAQLDLRELDESHWAVIDYCENTT